MFISKKKFESAISSAINEAAKDFDTAVNAKVEEIRESLVPVYAPIDSDDYLYRPLTGRKYNDLSPLAQTKMIEIAVALYETNPLAHRILEITKDFIVGEGIGYEAANDKVKMVLDDFWKDPINNMVQRQHDWAMELGLYGELCLPTGVNQYNGKVTLGFVNPMYITSIETNKNNCLIIENIKLKRKKEFTKRNLKVININNNVNCNKYGYLTGDCFFFKINSFSDSPRGRSDILSLADWLAAYDKYLFNVLDRNAFINAFLWDVELKGASEKEIKNFLNSMAPPKPGSIRAHNDKVKYTAVTPDMKHQDASTGASLIKNHILSGAGFPDYYFAGIQGTGLVSEMSEPTLKKISARQKYFRSCMEYILKYVIDQAIIHKKLDKNIDKTFKVIMPDISQKDNNRNARAMSHMGRLLQEIGKYVEIIINNEDRIGKENADNILSMYSMVSTKLAKVIALTMGQMGIETDVQNETKQFRSQI